jgi:hypothetical protein
MGGPGSGRKKGSGLKRTYETTGRYTMKNGRKVKERTGKYTVSGKQTNIDTSRFAKKG